VPFAVKIATIHIHVGPLKGQNLANFWTGNFRQILLFTEVHGENTPYSSSESNESDIVNRQSGGEKLMYLNFTQ